MNIELSAINRLADALAHACYKGESGRAVVQQGTGVPGPLTMPTELLHVTVIPAAREMLIRHPPRPVLSIYQPIEPTAPETVMDLDVVTIGLAYQWHCESRARERVRGWLSYIDAAITHLRTQCLARLPAATLVCIEQRPLYEPRHLAKFQTLTSILRCTYHMQVEVVL